MITAVLTMAVVWCLFYGRIPLSALIPLCLALGVSLSWLGRHKHTHFLTIDVLAQTSRLNAVNPSLKFWAALALMTLCVSARSAVVGTFLAAVTLLLTVLAGGVRLGDYLRLLALPLSFLMISGLALLFEISSQHTGLPRFQVFGVRMSVSYASQARTALVMARSLGALGCLYLISLSTPMSELIGVLRRARCPDVMIELMYLIYRYIFILLSVYHTMKDAAKSRLGFADYRTSLRTTGNLYSQLLSRSYRKASVNFDAMESRCYDAGIRFLENSERITAAQVCAAAGIIIFTLGLTILLK